MPFDFGLFSLFHFFNFFLSFFRFFPFFNYLIFTMYVHQKKNNDNKTIHTHTHTLSNWLIQLLNWLAVNMAWIKLKQWSKVWTMVIVSIGLKIPKKFINWKHYGQNTHYGNRPKIMDHLNRLIHFINYGF